MTYALSIRQPWAELILQGNKTIETRRWDTEFRGEFYIHAGKTIDEEACKKYDIDPATLKTGAILGKAEIVDVKEYSTEEEFLNDDNKHKAGFYGFAKPMFGFILHSVQRITPIPARGNLKFFEVNVNGQQD